MEIEIVSGCGDLSVEIDTDKMPKILTLNPQKSLRSIDNESVSDTRSRISNDECGEVYSIELEQRAETIRKLQRENEIIIKERDEILEEYEDELKAIQMKNDEYEKENYEMKQEIKILYNRIEEFQTTQETLVEIEKRNIELETAILQSEKIIKELNETNKVIAKIFPNAIDKVDNFIDNSCNDTVEDLIVEKKNLIKRILDLDSRYLDSVKEIEEIKNELIIIKLKYAESETQKDEIYKLVIDKSKRKRFNWNFFKFWKRNKI